MQRPGTTATRSSDGAARAAEKAPLHFVSEEEAPT